MRLFYDCRDRTYRDSSGNVVKTDEHIHQDALDRCNLELQRNLLRQVVDQLAIVRVNK